MNPTKCKMCGQETREPTKMDGDCLYCPACVFNRAEMLRHDLDVIYRIISAHWPDIVERVKGLVDEAYQAAPGGGGYWDGYTDGAAHERQAQAILADRENDDDEI